MPTILLIEDDADIREAVSLCLEDEGMTVSSVPSGAKAFGYLAEHPAPSVILLDLNMPGMPGADFCARLKADPALASIPVILLSADAELRSKAAALGVAYCPKPIRIEPMLKLVRSFCK